MTILVIAQLAVKHIFAFAHYPRAVFRHEGDFVGDVRKKRRQLVVLVATRHHKTDAAGFHFGVLLKKTLAVIGFVVA